MKDGIYFDMPEAQYHKLERLSSSGIKNILTSIPTFWAKSWMADIDDDCDDDIDPTKAQILGRAYHVATFEPATLNDRFVGEPDWGSIDDLLTSDAAVKKELKDRDQPQSKAGEDAIDRANRLLEIEPKFNIKSIIEWEFSESVGNRERIGFKYWAQIKRDIGRIEANPEIYDLVSGGASEVTILWTCPDSGIKMKARIDKLKTEYFADLKSFANKNGKPVNEAIRDQVQYYGYYISMRVYQIAISMIRQLDLQIINTPSEDDMETPENWPSERFGGLIECLRKKTSPHVPWLLFQEKNGIPNILARKLILQRLPEGVESQAIGASENKFSMGESALCMKADLEIRRAKQLFLHAMEAYGPDSEWYPFDMIGEIGDDSFRDYFLNSMPE